MIAYVPQRGDLVWLSLDPTLGNEQAKRRPVLVISPGDYNSRGLKLAIVCPITNRAKHHMFDVSLPPNLPEVSGVIQADQIRSVDWQIRMANKITSVSEEVVLQVVGLQLALLDPDGAFSGSSPDADE